MQISVALITLNEQENLPRTLESLQPLVGDGLGEIIVVDSGSNDRTLEIARSYGAKIFSEPWQGFAAQKNSALDKASGDWVLQLDADEALEPELVAEIRTVLGHRESAPSPLTAQANPNPNRDLEYRGYWIPRKNFFLGRWIRHGGFYPDPKLRLVRRGQGRFEEYGAHPTMRVPGRTRALRHALVHHAYPTLSGYIEHMNRYSSSGARVAVEKGKGRFNPADILIRPLATFLYNYLLRLGFLDGREGLLLHLYHSVYVSWKYAKAWELSRKQTL